MKNTSEEIIYRRDSARSQKQLLPSLSQVDDVHLYVRVLKVNFREDLDFKKASHPISFLLPHVLLHGGLAVVRPDVGGGRQHLRHVILYESKG